MNKQIISQCVNMVGLLGIWIIYGNMLQEGCRDLHRMRKEEIERNQGNLETSKNASQRP